jgi:hypothetical protein
VSYSLDTPPPRQYTPPPKSSPAPSSRKHPQKHPSKLRYRAGGLGVSRSDKGFLQPPTILQPTISPTSRQKDCTPYKQSPQLEVREIGVQTDPPDSNQYHFCQSPLNHCSTSTLFRKSHHKSFPYVASSTSPARDNDRDLKGPGDFQQIKGSRDFPISNDLNVPLTGLLSDGNKTDSFSSSDALPDVVERFFDRASFSIHGYDTEPISPLYTDPDGLRKNLRQFMDETPSDRAEQSTSGSAKRVNPCKPKVSRLSAAIDNTLPKGSVENTPKRSLDDTLPKRSSPTRLSSSSPTLTSISGVLFADPFHSSIPRSTVTTSSTTKTRSPSRSDHSLRRKLSLPIPSQEVPPVPAIPEAFRKDPSHANGALDDVNGSSPSPPSIMSPVIRPHSPVYTVGSGRRFSTLSQHLVYVIDANGRRQSSRGSSGHPTNETIYGSPPSEIPTPHRLSQTVSNAHRLSQAAPVGPLSYAVNTSAHGAHSGRADGPFPVSEARTPSSSSTVLRRQGSPSSSVSSPSRGPSSVALSSQIPRRSLLWNVIVRTKPATVIPTSVIESNRAKSQAATKPRKLQRKKSSKV